MAPTIATCIRCNRFIFPSWYIAVFSQIEPLLSTLSTFFCRRTFNSLALLSYNLWLFGKIQNQTANLSQWFRNDLPMAMPKAWVYRGFRMNKFAFLLVGLLVVGGVFVYSGGCGPRFGVLKDKAINAVDKVLGELDVKEKDITQKQATLKNDLSKVQEERIKLQVRLEQMEKRKVEMEKEVEESKKKLDAIKVILGEFSEGQDTIERNGKTYTKAEVNKMAADLVAKHKNLTGDMASAVTTSVEAMKRSFSFLKEQENAAKEMLGKLDSKIAEIRSKKEAINVIKQSAVATGDSSIMSKIEELNKQVQDMDVDIETAMRIEESKMNDIMTQSKSVDELLTDPTDISSTMDEINAILGK